MSKEPEFIECKVCGNTDPLSKKFKCSKCGANNWGHQLPPKSRSGCLWEIVGGIIFLAAIAGYNWIKDYRNSHWSQSKVESSFSKNVVLVYHEFVYELEFDDPDEGSLYFIRTRDGDFTQWQKGMPPNSVTGCGLLVDTTGKIATTKNLTYPWLNDWDLIALRREVQVFRGPPFNIRSGGNYKLFTVKLGYYLNGGVVNDPGAFIPCATDGNWEKGIRGLIPVKSPDSLQEITRFLNNNHDAVEMGEEIFIIGYPLQINPAEKLLPFTTNNKIDSVRSESFTYPLTSLFTLEGAPVFNKKGAVIGFNTIDENGNLKAVRTQFERTLKD